MGYEIMSEFTSIKRGEYDKLMDRLEEQNKLISNMANYIARLDIDYDVCTPMCNEGGCLAEKLENDGVDCGLDVCIECVKNWFSEDR